MQQLGCESHSVTCVSCYVHVYGNKVIIIIIIIKLAQIYKFQLPVRSARVSHYDPRIWKVSCVSGGHLYNVNL